MFNNIGRAAASAFIADENIITVFAIKNIAALSAFKTVITTHTVQFVITVTAGQNVIPERCVAIKSDVDRGRFGRLRFHTRFRVMVSSRCGDADFKISNVARKGQGQAVSCNSV